MVFPDPMISETFRARLSNGQPLGLGSVIRWLAERVLIGVISAMMLAPFVIRSANAANDFELKISGYFNLTPGGAVRGVSGQTGSSVGVVPEGEIELTPQYHLSMAAPFWLPALRSTPTPMWGSRSRVETC
jgi:hypothetical protein